MVHGKNRIPYWIDRRLNGLAGPEYDATISFGLPIEPEDSQYGESWLKVCQAATTALWVSLGTGCLVGKDRGSLLLGLYSNEQLSS